MVYQTKPKNLFTMNLSEEQVKQLEELAAYKKTFKSSVIREALQVAYDKMEAEKCKN